MGMKKKELVQIIEETILEMLKENDEGLVGLMMEHDKNIGGEVTDKATFVNETIEKLSDRLGIINEEEAVDGDMLTEQQKMLGLVEWLEKDED